MFGDADPERMVLIEQCRELTALVGALTEERDDARKRVVVLEQEIEILRDYMNGDIEAMADKAMRVKGILHRTPTHAFKQACTGVHDDCYCTELVNGERCMAGRQSLIHK